MNLLSTFTLVFCLAGSPVVDGHDAVIIPAKSSDHLGANPARDNREGGESIADALPIVNIPFMDTGATCDNIDDYDEVCPYSGSTSPDVVYALSGGPTYDMMLFVDLCGSLYDTKLYVYDQDLALLECNDDFYFDAVCGYYVSAIESLLICATETLYIVVDGYGGDCGEYVLNVEEYACPMPPVLECPPEGIPEGEPQLCDGYIDTYNGGCDAESIVFQPLLASPGQSELQVCGISGWFEIEGNLFGDSDWFEVIATGTQISITTQTEIFSEITALVMTDCDDIGSEQTWTMFYWPETMMIATTPGQFVYLCVRPAVSEPPRCIDMYGFDYHLHVSGVSSVSSIAETTWSAIKLLYR